MTTLKCFRILASGIPTDYLGYHLPHWPCLYLISESFSTYPLSFFSWSDLFVLWVATHFRWPMVCSSLSALCTEYNCFLLANENTKIQRNQVTPLRSDKQEVTGWVWTQVSVTDHRSCFPPNQSPCSLYLDNQAP